MQFDMDDHGDTATLIATQQISPDISWAFRETLCEKRPPEYFR